MILIKNHQEKIKKAKTKKVREKKKRSKTKAVQQIVLREGALKIFTRAK